jgi:hypothetical protein
MRVVQCRCLNGKHRLFERRQAYAFEDSLGNIVVKKCKTMILPL